ncbi:MAG: long-chain fatty acid--CoA ligase [Actinobacteria bacterium]|nr:MAG: long-chain fatty acid--CoA ligase [Actinomycetota bacterium]RIK07590.1 MAG: AMP-dependent synthetase [Acidobacteriota bacterium]
MLAETVTRAARRWHDATAYVAADGWSLSYRDLDRLSDEVAVGLAARGISDGDVLALLLPALPEYFVAYAAAAKLGAVTAGVNPRLAPPERNAVMENAGPRLVLATADLLAGQEARIDAELVVVEPAHSADVLLADLRRPGIAPPLRPDPERPVAIVYTSGTTGPPRGAVFAGRQLRTITDIDTGGVWGGGSVSMATTALTHLGPMTKLPGTLVRGGTTHLLTRWTAETALEMIDRHRMTGFGAIPTQAALMLASPHFAEYDLSSLQAVIIGGGPATPKLVRECRSRLAPLLSVRYSCTEAGIGVGTSFDDPPEDAEVSVGRPHAGVRLTVRDTEGSILPDGEIGEVCLASAAAMSAYWNNEEATEAVFTADGAVRTGDLGYVDDQGRLHLAGRSKEMYVRGGYNVYPQQVEAVLTEYPGISAVAVVPRVDEIMGEVGTVVVVPSDPRSVPTLDELRAFAARSLAKHELPEGLVVLDELPLTSMDKLDRRALAQLVAGSEPA